MSYILYKETITVNVSNVDIRWQVKFPPFYILTTFYIKRILLYMSVMLTLDDKVFSLLYIDYILYKENITVNVSDVYIRWRVKFSPFCITTTIYIKRILV